MSTTPIASAHVCTLNASPSNWVGNIAPGTHCRDDIADFKSYLVLDDFHQYVDDAGSTMGSAHRHSHGYPEHSGLWRVLVRQNVDGRLWDHRTWGVTDDFGWLVEVPAR